mgnify:CR=1 FL=1
MLIFPLAIEPEDYETYDPNPIIKLSLECGGFKRYFIGIFIGLVH